MLAWLTAFSGRTNNISVGPLLPLLQADLHLSYAQGGLLFAIPVLMMGLFAIPSGLLVARIGVKRMLLLSLVLLAAGGGLRALSNGAASLFAFTALTGAGIGLVQPVLPRLIKDWFSGRAGVFTGIYSSGFPMGAVAGAALAVPLAVGLHLTWRGPFVLWSVVVWLLVIGWLFVPLHESQAKASLAPFARIFTNRLCWTVSAVFLSQSMVYYVLNASLTSYYQSFGWPLAHAASTVAFLSVGGLVGGFCGPVASDHVGRRPVMLTSALVAILAILGLLAAPQHVYWLWAMLSGASTAGLFTVCLIIPVDVAGAEEVGAFTGLMLAVGYGGVIVGPTLVGLLRDVTGSYLYGMLALLAVALVQLWLTIITPETAPGR